MLLDTEQKALVMTQGELSLKMNPPQPLSFFLEGDLPSWTQGVVTPDIKVHTGMLTPRSQRGEYFALFELPLDAENIQSLLSQRCMPSGGTVSPYDMLYHWERLKDMPKRLRTLKNPEYNSFQMYAQVLRNIMAFNPSRLVSEAKSKLIPYEQALQDALKFRGNGLYQDSLYGNQIVAGELESILRVQFTRHIQSENPTQFRVRPNKYQRRRGVNPRQPTPDQIMRRFRRLPQEERKNLWDGFIAGFSAQQQDGIAQDFVSALYKGCPSFMLEAGEVILNLDRDDVAWSFRQAGLDGVRARFASILETDITFSRVGSGFKKVAVDPDRQDQNGTKPATQDQKPKTSKFILPIVRIQEGDPELFKFGKLPPLVETAVLHQAKDLIPKGLDYDPRFIDSYSGYLLASLLSASTANWDLNQAMAWGRGREQRKIGPTEYPVYALRIPSQEDVLQAALARNLIEHARAA